MTNDKRIVPIEDLDVWKASGGDGYIAPLHGIDENNDHMCDICCGQVSDHKGVLVESIAATV